ncbi:3-hydroxyisobutyryl-CoA hydrolase-like protein 2, mitochondrial [Pyrus x bretschneideri]|uniref:3-hydroxyisobutyryl-CoA hydrolase-like protein 2, mitochondrial n=1 Tax=Pyrus x bretschneideri TaxID=225117 RepID=UPI00202F61AE|nr:3-hydroxyisobutyryl-CoA hydrolase-like protein 2, mitochondrial [Pyrus x bretschneideri]
MIIFLPSYAQYDDVQDLLSLSLSHHFISTEVTVEGRAKSRAAILNGPSALNALHNSMAARLKRLYESWEDNPDIGFVLMKGSGRAFCSGADAVSLYQLVNEGDVDECKKFFETLYKFVCIQGTYLKPHVAIMDGITMGAGAGIAIPGMLRVVTDKTIFSNPEAQIGFHPDAGASFYPSRLPGYLGIIYFCTFEKENGVEMIACRLATHYTLNARLAMVEERLGNLVTDEPSVIETALAQQYGDLVYLDRRSILSKLDVIDRCFSHDTIEEIFDALEKEAADSYDEWCKTVLKKIKEASPLSLIVSLQSIREGRFQPLDQCQAREYRTSLAAISNRVSSDFSEGVRARLVDKDFAPKWNPTSFKDVSKDMVDCYFLPLPEVEPELKLPTAMREPFMQGTDSPKK